MLLDMDALKVNAQDASASVKRIQKWLIALVDNINDCLCNIDQGNLNDSFYQTLGTLGADKVVADSVITNTLITKNLYAEYGDIAELTVDRLLTANKVTRYKARDPSDLNYISIQGQTIQLRTGTTQGATEQHQNRKGEPLFWQDAEQLAMDTVATADPVIVYAYHELCKAELSFLMDDESGYYTPKLTMGAGVGQGDWGKAFLYKGVAGLQIDYFSGRDGSLRRILLSDDGIFLTPYALENLDFYATGFSARYSGETVVYTWTTDDAGRITSLRSEDGVTIPISWSEEVL